MNGLREALISQFTETHVGEPWYGSSRTALLEGVSAVDAAAVPEKGGHSMWQLVLHMTAWTREVTKRLRGATPGTPQDGDWPSVVGVSEVNWQGAQSDLTEAHAAVVKVMQAMTDDQWSTHVGISHDAPLGTGVTNAGMLIGLAQHDAYHVGQLAAVRWGMT